MSTRMATSLKSTIVLFMHITLLGSTLAACAGAPPRAAQAVPCAAAATLMCEKFGPESRCSCADPAAVERQLAGLGQLGAIAHGGVVQYR